MKFPSIKTLAGGAANTVKRFPFELFFALAGTIAFTVKIHHNFIYGDESDWYTRIMMTANLGLLLSLAATLFTASKNYNRLKNALIRLIVALTAISLLFILNPADNLRDYLRFFLFCFAFHLLVAFAAFISIGRIQGFWQFNKILFLRILASVLYSGVLYLGLVIAIYATISLFNIEDHNSHIYAYLFAWIAGMFNSLFFLAGVPKDTHTLDEDLSYPKGLKIFTQYVLIPLATIYFLILLAYEVKIIAEWRLPKGLVSDLVLGYSVFGILSLLLIYPIREQEGNKWIKTYARWFYFLMIPLIVLLFIAVMTRVVRYGITEERYFLLALALWLTFISVYFLLARKQNIKIIPISLCLVTLLSIYGPQSAFSVSRYSQRKILINLFKKYGKYHDGKLVPLGKSLMSRKDGEEAAAKLNYLVSGYGIHELQPYLATDLRKVTDSIKKADKVNRNSYYPYTRMEETGWLTSYLGLDKFLDNNGYNMSFYDVIIKNKSVLDIKGYDYAIPTNSARYSDTTLLPQDKLIVIQQVDSNNNIILYLNKEQIAVSVSQYADSLHKVCDKLKPINVAENASTKTYILPEEQMTIYRQTTHFDVVLRMHTLSFNYEGEKLNAISDASGYFLIRRR